MSCIFLFNKLYSPSSSPEEGEFLLGEAILAKAQVSVKDIEASGINNCMIVENGYYTCTKSGNYKVVCIGGGAGGSGITTYNEGHPSSEWGLEFTLMAAPGGSGYYNSTTVHLNNGDNVYVTIGAGGNGGCWTNIQNAFTGWKNTYSNPASGGITSFGSYVAANGGSCFYNWSNSAGYNNGVSIDRGYHNDGWEWGYAFSNGSHCTPDNNCATGGYLYFNGLYDVSNVETNGMRIYYGEGGNSGTLGYNYNGNYYYMNSNGNRGNNGIVLISWAD